MKLFVPKQFGKLGRRLYMAFIFSSLLTLLIGVVIFFMWGKLATQINASVENSLPMLTTSYNMERYSTNLQMLLKEREQTQRKSISEQQKQAIYQLLDNLRDFPIEQKPQRDFYTQLVDELSHLIDEQDILLEKRRELENRLAQLLGQLAWMHDAVGEDIKPLLNEIEWHVSQMINEKNVQENSLQLLLESTLLQELFTTENELISLVEEIAHQRYSRDIDVAFHYINVKTDEIVALNEKLKNYPSTIAHRQVLQEIIAITRYKGDIYQTLIDDVENERKLKALTPELTQKLSQFDDAVRGNVFATSEALNNLNADTRKLMATGKIVIVVIIVASLLLSIIAMKILIDRRLVARLNRLSDDLAHVAKGHLTEPVLIEGKDEIGLLSRRLRRFWRQMKEVEASNALNLINNTDASLITCHHDGKVETVNPSAATLLGIGKEQSNKPLWQLFSGEASVMLKAQFSIESSLYRVGQSECIITMVQSHTSRFLQFNIREYPHKEEHKYIVTITDITRQELSRLELQHLVALKTQDLQEKNQQLNDEIIRREQAQKHLIQTQEELIQTAKMAVVGQAMTSLAHELNQPLSAINTYLYSAKLTIEMKKYDQLPDSIERIEKLSARMNRIITALRNFSRKSPSEISFVSAPLKELVESAMVLVESRSKREQCTIINQLSGELTICADPTQIEQVLVNLFVNAMDAIAGSGKGQIIVMSLSSTARQQLVGIADSGKGFNRDVLPKLFTPFTTTKDVGLGLGLSICRSIMQRFGYEIYLASTLTGGAMVVLEFTNDTITDA
ncbi:ATP-binding protein [Proteus myxofaciens]|uniref:C4-dicarboxylate transport sensor protein DctB n=1 Tax=Proteus myxofaciens ATCC 19692 TaxID=1354337 RepID=A0A198G782_9GAMM|nr:ATP-binding protein [Proteus myxofaciens]OAT33242.1 phosphoglycerate transport system sensor protein [Proteus myxofaciens ATCC 19692]